MRMFLGLFLLLASLRLVPAQTNAPAIDLNAVLDTAQQWAQDNLDEDVLRVLESVDHERVAAFFQNYQEHLAGDSVLDMAQLKTNSVMVLPLLDAHEATQPYAAWLRSRMDYFDVAEQLKKTTSPPTNMAPGQPVAPMPNPTFKAEQEIWSRQLAPRPLPRAAEKYVPQLKQIFTAERVPVALVWLAEVESGFDPRAKSPAGATGLFQLMPATAKSYGLHLWPFDQRKQVEPSAQAAAQHLRRLYKIFGDWRLAVAAYNCGEGTVLRALQRYQTKSYTGIAMHLPAETQMYVPKVEATVLKREGIALQKLKLSSTAQVAEPRAGL